jgi:hypothetical protein
LLDSSLISEHLGPTTSPNAHQWRDTNLKASRLPHVLRLLPDLFGSWRDRCRRVHARALEHLVADDSLKKAIAHGIRRGQVDKDLRQVRLETRIRHLEGREASAERQLLQNELILCDAIIEAVRAPAVRLDVVGAVVLTDQPCPVLD